MRLRVLGCSGAEYPGRSTSAFLVDESILLDAGTIGTVLDDAEQLRLKYIFVTHTHLDHIKAIPFLAENIVINGLDHNLQLISIPRNVETLRRHLLNGDIWPDFTQLPSPKRPVVSYREITPGLPMEVDGYSVTAYVVNHAVPGVGYLVRKGDAALLYTGDTGPTEALWREVGELSALIVEVSFPDAMEELAIRAGHLTPRLLQEELAKLTRLPPLILITHRKPSHAARIDAELEALGIGGMTILRDGDIYDI